MPSVYDEMAVIGINAFTKMLNIECELNAESPEEAFDFCRGQIVGVLNQGAVVSETVDGFTPLMLYATYHINDERFTRELTRSPDQIKASTGLRGYQMGTSRRVNALSCAVTSGNLWAIEQLLATSLFMDTQDNEVALELIAILNLASAIPLCVKYHCNTLFTYDFFSQMTPLMYACHFGHIEVVREILLTNPGARLLTMRSVEGRSAYLLARNAGHQEILMLLETHPGITTERLRLAVEHQNLDACIAILNNVNLVENPFVLEQNGMFSSLLPMAYAGEGQHKAAIINELKAYLLKLSSSQQINTLVLTISRLFTGLSPIAEEYLFQLDDLRQHFHTLTDLIMPAGIFGYTLPEALWVSLRDILLQAPLRTIKFSCYSPDIFDEETQDACLVNFNTELAAELVNCLLNNTSLVDCQLYLPSAYASLMKIMQLICQRNRAIQAVQSLFAKDHIFNGLVPAINEQINLFKQDERHSAEERQALHELLPIPRQIYSLKELAAATLWKKHPEIAQRKTGVLMVDTILEDVGRSFV